MMIRDAAASVEHELMKAAANDESMDYERM